MTTYLNRSQFASSVRFDLTVTGIQIALQQSLAKASAFIHHCLYQAVPSSLLIFVVLVLTHAAAVADPVNIYLYDSAGNLKRIVDLTSSPINVLVVRVDFPDVMGSALETEVTTRLNEADAWLQTVSYGRKKLNPLFLGPEKLSKPRAFYTDASRSLLVEMASEVLSKVDASIPSLLDGPTTDPQDNIEQIVIVLNDTSVVGDLATTGNWPYLINGKRRNLSVSIQGPTSTTPQYSHGLAHQYGLKDLYIHDNVTADPSLVDAAQRWDNMAKPFEGAHPLVWSKQLGVWVTDSGGQIKYIPRPTQSNPRTGEPAIDLNYQATLQTGEIGAIAVGLTEGVTAFDKETHFYWIEARKPGLAADTVPTKGVLVYYANNLVPQGEAPVVVRDTNPGTMTRDDAPMQVGQVFGPAGTGITVKVDSESQGNSGFKVSIEYRSPSTQYDVSVGIGNPAWTSPDIWVDNRRDGGGYQEYDAVAFLTTAGPGQEQPIAGEINRVYARVHNAGPAVARDVQVAFKMSDPYHTVGGEGDFAPAALKIIPAIPPGEFRDVYFEWKPVGANDPHSCIRVELRGLLNDTNAANNTAQQNVSIEQSRTRSPYTEVALDFSITNDTPQPRLVYFRADEVPPQWSQRFAADSALLGSGQRYIGKLTVKPNDEAPACRNQEIFVTGWTPRGDTLVQLGGTTLNVALRKTATIDVSTSASSCSLDSEYGTVGRRYCQRVVAKGCTDPAQPNQTVSIRYTDAVGQSVWRDVQTDATGCFEDSYVARTGGPLKVTAYHPGDACNSSATHTTTIGLPPSDDWDGERRREWGIFVEYLHLEHKLGIRSPWMLGARYALQLNASWFIESELSFGASKSMAGATGRVWQLTAHSIYQTQPFGTLGWRAFALGGAGVIAFDGFAGSAKSSTLDLGIGLKVPLSPRVNLRGDIRLVSGSSVYGAGASRNVEATLGLSARF